MKQVITKLLVRFIKYRYNKNIRNIFNNYFRKIINNNQVEDINCNTNEKKIWKKKWSIFGPTPSPLAWKAFYPYMKGNANFVPNEIARNYIEPILTPQEYQSFYNDKNSFGLFLNESWLPKTFLRSIDGKLLNGKYEPVRSEDFFNLFINVDKIVVKPSKDMGGKGVVLFQRKGDIFTNKQGEQLSLSYLEKNYKTNYLLQECLTQYDYMAQFNPTSVNTIRIATYRNVKTGRIEVIGAVLRIGGKGSFVDNACSGGSFICIEENGTLGKFACNEYGLKQTIYNDIDFEHSEFTIPKWDNIKQFVCDVALRMPHMSLFANDVAIDSEGNPRLIEVNTIQFSYWFYQFNGKAVFDKYTDDVIDYCLKEKNKIKPAIILKYNY